MSRVFCPRCKVETEADMVEAGGFSACTQCGMLLEDNAFSSDPTFSKASPSQLGWFRIPSTASNTTAGLFCRTFAKVVHHLGA